MEKLQSSAILHRSSNIYKIRERNHYKSIINHFYINSDTRKTIRVHGQF